MKKKRYLKKWCEKVLLFINVLIFVILASVNNIDNLLNFILLLIIFLVNCKILKNMVKS